VFIKHTSSVTDESLFIFLLPCILPMFCHRCFDRFVSCVADGAHHGSAISHHGSAIFGIHPQVRYVLDEMRKRERSKTSAIVVSSMVILFNQTADGGAPLC
jgi:hypothetical protein